MSEVVATYLELFDDLLSRRCMPAQFRITFCAVYKNDSREMSRAEFEALDWLFGELDEYTADPELRKKAGGLDDEQLIDRMK